MVRPIDLEPFRVDVKCEGSKWNFGLIVKQPMKHRAASKGVQQHELGDLQAIQDAWLPTRVLQVARLRIVDEKALDG